MKRQRKIPDSHNYEAAYKKADSGELLWISCFAENSAEADKLMDTHIALNHANKGYSRYAGALLIKNQTPMNTIKPTIYGIITIAFIITIVAFKALPYLNYTR